MNFDENNDEFESESNDMKSSGSFSDMYESNKKLVWIVGGLILLVLMLFMMKGCTGNNKKDVLKKEPELVFASEKEELSVGNSTRLFLNSKNIGNKSQIIWTTSDKNVVTVDNNGNINAVNLGEAIVSATYLSNEGKKYVANCTIIVSAGNKNVQVNDVKFLEGELLISRGEKYNLLKRIEPSNGYITNCFYTSDDVNIVEVSSNGEIKAVSFGKTTVRMKVNDGKFHDEIIINVVSDDIEPTLITNPTAINFNEKKYNLVVDDKKKLEYQYLPTEAYVKDVIWKSSNDEVAKVSKDGEVTALKVGTAIITLTARNGIEASTIIEVKEKFIPVSSITLLSPKDLNMIVNTKAPIIANVLPENATNKKIIYKSSNENIITVDDQGIVYAVSPGTAVVVLKTEDQGFMTITNVHVNGNYVDDNGSNDNSHNSSDDSSNSNSCTDDRFIQISSNSGGAINNSTTGNSRVVNKNIVEVYTNEIGSNADCGEVQSMEYCKSIYNGASCSKYTRFNKGDILYIYIPSGKGVYQFNIRVNFKDGKRYSKKYYFNYDVNDYENNKDNITWTYKGKSQFTDYNIFESSFKERNPKYYCFSSNEGLKCMLNNETERNNLKITYDKSNPNLKCYSGTTNTTYVLGSGEKYLFCYKKNGLVCFYDQNKYLIGCRSF